MAQLQTERDHLAAHLAQLQADNQTNPAPGTIILWVDAGFGTGPNLTWLIEMGYLIYLSIHEANLTDYAAMTLAGDGSYTLQCELVPWREDGVKVKATTPHHPPWRTVQIAETPGDLITSYLILNLNEPNVLGDVSWVKPGKYIGIWWAIHLGHYTWPPAAARPFDSARQPPRICPP